MYLLEVRTVYWQELGDTIHMIHMGRDTIYCDIEIL